MKIQMVNDNIVQVTFILCIFTLIVLCTGEPDILDGLIKIVNEK